MTDEIMAANAKLVHELLCHESKFKKQGIRVGCF